MVVVLDPGGGVPLLSAVSTELYAAFLLPPPSNSSGDSPLRHESESRTPHTVIPMHRATARQSLTTLAYAVGLAFVMSSSVMCTSTPRAAKLDSVVR